MHWLCVTGLNDEFIQLSHSYISTVRLLFVEDIHNDVPQYLQSISGLPHLAFFEERIYLPDLSIDIKVCDEFTLCFLHLPAPMLNYHQRSLIILIVVCCLEYKFVEKCHSLDAISNNSKELRVLDLMKDEV